MADCRIERIEVVSFGKLSNFVLEPSAGLNLLCAPNESGKSTLAAFLRFAFYGYTDGRKKDLAENDKKLYTPWSTPKSEGSVTVLRGEKRYRVFRRVTGNQETCTVTDLATGHLLPDGVEPGVFLFGVSEEVFGRTLFFRQLTLPTGKDGVMAEQLQNIAVSAEEQVGSRRAVERLTKAKNELKGRAGSGLLPALEQEAVRLESALAEAERERAEIDTLREEQRGVEVKLSENGASELRVNAELRNLDCFEAAKKLAQLTRIQKEAERAKAAYETAKAACRGTDHAILRGLAEQRAAYGRAEESAAAAKRALDAVSATDCPSGSDDRFGGRDRSGAVPMGIGGSALVMGLVFLFVFLPAGIVCAAVGAVLLIFGLLKRSRAKKRAAEAASTAQTVRERQSALRKAYEDAERHALALQRELEQRLADCGLEGCEEIGSLQDACHAADRLQAAYESALRASEIAFEGVDLSALEEPAREAKEPARDRAAAERELHFLHEQARLLREKVQKTDHRIAALEGRCADPALLTGKLNAVRRRLAENKRKYEAYEAARAGIEEAADTMKSMVAPRLGEIAGLYFSAATGGKYGGMAVDTRLAMNLQDENGISREVEYLSAGTRDVAYLSLRLALTELLYGSSGMPLVLDDAFGRLDDHRLRAVLRALAAAAEKHQIFIFCCTKREEAALADLRLPFVSLQF